MSFFIWKIINKDYMRYIRFVTRKLRKKGVIKDGILTFRGLRTEALPKMLSKAISRRRELFGRKFS